MVVDKLAAASRQRHHPTSHVAASGQALADVGDVLDAERPHFFALVHRGHTVDLHAHVANRVRSGECGDVRLGHDVERVVTRTDTELNLLTASQQGVQKGEPMAHLIQTVADHLRRRGSEWRGIEGADEDVARLAVWPRHHVEGTLAEHGPETMGKHGTSHVFSGSTARREALEGSFPFSSSHDVHAQDAALFAANRLLDRARDGTDELDG